MSKITNLRELFIEELRDLHSAETQLVKALPKMAKASGDASLRTGFEHHLEQTKNHVARLEQIFESLGEKPKGRTCDAMKGLVEEGDEWASQRAESALRDAGIIVAAQKVEHYEIAGYGSVISMAQRLGLEDAADLLRQTLDEEAATDETLTEIAMGLPLESIEAGVDS
ncbi:MAG TPA: ferritin-like domain-containing protein [Candidatus Didemnitutus sp.]|jgi:ferritin-like metal-binding protein YciE